MASNTKDYHFGSALLNLVKLLRLEKEEIISIYWIAAFAGILYLVIPLGIQSIISFVMAGSISTSIILLIVVVVVSLILNGTLQIKMCIRDRGVSVASLESPDAKKQGIKLTEGALISNVTANSAAEKAGIKANDVVIAINERKVASSADLLEIVGSHRIGDEIRVKINRSGTEKEFKVKLQNLEGTVASLRAPESRDEFALSLGADLMCIRDSQYSYFIFP